MMTYRQLQADLKYQRDTLGVDVQVKLNAKMSVLMAEWVRLADLEHARQHMEMHAEAIARALDALPPKDSVPMPMPMPVPAQAMPMPVDEPMPMLFADAGYKTQPKPARVTVTYHDEYDPLAAGQPMPNAKRVKKPKAARYTDAPNTPARTVKTSYCSYTGQRIKVYEDVHTPIVGKAMPNRGR